MEFGEFFDLSFFSLISNYSNHRHKSIVNNYCIVFHGDIFSQCFHFWNNLISWLVQFPINKSLMPYLGLSVLSCKICRAFQGIVKCQNSSNSMPFPQTVWSLCRRACAENERPDCTLLLWSVLFSLYLLTSQPQKSD